MKVEVVNTVTLVLNDEETGIIVNALRAFMNTPVMASTEEASAEHGRRVLKARDMADHLTSEIPDH